MTTSEKIVDQDDFQPHYRVINQKTQVQICQKVKLDPGIPVDGPTPFCAKAATLRFQAAPLFHPQDQFCTGQGANRDRPFHLSGLPDTKDTPIEIVISTRSLPD